LLSVLLDDLRAQSTRTGGSASLGKVAARVVLHPRFRALIYWRLSMLFYRRKLTRPLSALLAARILRSCGAELGAGASIGRGLCLVHTVGIVVGQEVRAGDGLVLHQGVTLGERTPGGGQPSIGKAVVVGAGASILGPLSVGDGAVIAAGSVVLGDVPADVVVAGAPARVVKGARSKGVLDPS
jgi:serine O-acetyltransferase